MAQTPAKIGKYKILGLIGTGGMGAVYKAEHPTLKRPVIIKKLTSSGNKDLVERFKREARIMMDFRHEQIVQVYDHFKEGSAFYIAMEFVDGENLEDLIKKKRYLSNEAAMLIFREICKALKYAHDNQVIHRDIKPANILISKEGVVKLVDFGVSTELEESDDDGLTKAGMTIGTPSYLAPEQIANAKNRDRRSDIYALGVVLYEMVIGKTPFRGGFTPEVILAIEKGKYTPPRKINPNVKPAIQKVIKKAMHHKVQKRFKDLQIVINKFSRYLGKYTDQNAINSSIKAFLEGKDDLKGKPKMKFPYRSVALALGAILIIGGLAASFVFVGKKGYYHEYFNADTHGAFRIAVKIRKGHKSAAENFLAADLYREIGNKLVAVKAIDLSFHEDSIEKDRQYYHFSTGKKYLEEGTYKVIVYAENEQFRENFYLEPRSYRKQFSGSDEAQLIKFSAGKKPPVLPVKLSVRVMGIHTGLSLKKSAEVAIFHKNRWINWAFFRKNASLRRRFVSGQRYRFRFKNKGYYTKTYNLTVRPEQTNISLNIHLVPVPGQLFIRARSEDIKVLVNNSPKYITGEKERKLKNLKPLSDKYQKLVLSPKDYKITAISSRFFTDTSLTKNISIKTGQKTYVTIKSDPENKSLKFEIK
jgi:serine/threonine-protein kinase